MNLPENLKYTASHEWIDPDKSPALVGITDHAQNELSDVVYVELPAVGREVKAGEAVAVVESVKAASDIYAPADGTIAEINESLQGDPSLVNSDPFGKGWLFKLTLKAGGIPSSLLDPVAYSKQISD